MDTAEPSAAVSRGRRRDEAVAHWGRDADDAAGFLFGFGPLRHWLRGADSDSRTEERARQAAAEAFRACRGDDDSGVRLTGRYWLVTAGRP